MSFFANKISPTTITFNTEDVSTVYFQNTAFMTEPVLVWSRWPGWDNSNLDDIYNLCKMKQAGIISDWPEDIKLGNQLSIPNWSSQGAVYYTFYAVLIGIDIDGPGVLTFMSYFNTPDLSVPTMNLEDNRDFLENTYSYKMIFNPDGSCVGTDEKLYLRDFIKPLRKQWHNATDGTVEVIEALMWDLSYAEAGLESEYPCFTEGVSTPYFTAPPNKYHYIRYNTNPSWQIQYGSRSYIYDLATGEYRYYNPERTFGINTNGASGVYCVPCFAIG